MVQIYLIGVVLNVSVITPVSGEGMVLNLRPKEIVRGRFYLEWMANEVRRVKFMMRRCLLCEDLFPSMEARDRHCRSCQNARRKFLNDERCALA